MPPALSAFRSALRWDPTRPHVLVIACSDGRLQEPTDEFLSAALGIRQYDRLYVAGGGGALSASGKEYLRAQQLRRECKFLVQAHDVQEIVLLFHGPTVDGPAEAMCADYRRKLPALAVPKLRDQQQRDADELLTRRDEWAGSARVRVFRCETTANGGLEFVSLNSTSVR
jgi:carbonic anhydrase